MPNKSHLKPLILAFSDYLSSTTKNSINLMNITYQTGTFETVFSHCPTHGFYGIFQNQNRSFLIALSPKLLYSLTSRYLGGSNTPEVQIDTLFTTADHFFGSHLLEWVASYFCQESLITDLKRTETHKKLCHVFFPDDAVHLTTISAELDGTVLGELFILFGDKGTP